MPVHVPSDILFDVFKFSSRLDINQHFEFVNGHWARCIEEVEEAHLPLFRMHKLWIVPLFCALHYSLVPSEETTVAEAQRIFSTCSDGCADKFLPFLSDEWPAQRIPFCIYVQRSPDANDVKKVTLNNGSWKIERPECAHFFLHFRQLCFREATLDVFNDRAVTLFLLDCPHFVLRTMHFCIRTTSEQLPFARVAQLAQQNVHLEGKKAAAAGTIDMESSDSPVLDFVLGGGQFCSELTIEAHKFALLFDVIKEFQSADQLLNAVPLVYVCVPPFPWHRRPFVEGTLCQMFHTSQKMAPLAHKFAFFDALSASEKFRCIVHFRPNEQDKIDFYEFRVGNNDQ